MYKRVQLWEYPGAWFYSKHCYFLQTTAVETFRLESNQIPWSNWVNEREKLEQSKLGKFENLYSNSSLIQPVQANEVPWIEIFRFICLLFKYKQFQSSITRCLVSTDLSEQRLTILYHITIQHFSFYCFLFIQARIALTVPQHSSTQTLLCKFSWILIVICLPILTVFVEFHWYKEVHFLFPC